MAKVRNTAVVRGLNSLFSDPTTIRIDTAEQIVVDNEPESGENHVTLADCFHAPEIRKLNLFGWKGQAGQLIWIQTMDNVEVRQVSVAITDEDGAVLEQGPAIAEGGGWWTYRTTATASGNPKVFVAVQDLPGMSLR